MGAESAITKQWRASYEMARDECNRLRAERDALKAELARHYTLSSDKDKYVFDRDMKAQFSAIDAARGE